jgi:hypothetical protein
MRFVAVDEESASGRFAAYGIDGKSIYEIAAERLAKSGIKASVHIASGDPTNSFLEEAELRRANTIFVDAGVSDGQGLDEIGSSLVTGAKCTVEIVR